MKDLKKDYLLELLDEAKELVVAKNVAIKHGLKLSAEYCTASDMICDRLLTALMVEYGFSMPKGLYNLKYKDDIFEWLDGDSEKEKRYKDTRRSIYDAELSVTFSKERINKGIEKWNKSILKQTTKKNKK